MKKILLGLGTLAAGVASAANCYSGACTGTKRLIDACWMWGHETGLVDGTNNMWKLDVAKEYYPMVEGMKSFGLDSMNVVRWDMPDRAFRDSLQGLRRVTWPVSGISLTPSGYKNVGYDELADWAFRAATEMPNVTGFDLDDFFRADGKTQLVVQTPKGPRKSCPTIFPYEKLLELRKRVDAFPRRLEIRAITYDGLLKRCVDPHDIQPTMELVDTVSYWTWKAKDIDALPQNLAAVKALAPGKRVELGVYLYDFSDKKVMPTERMELQLKLGLDLWRRGEVDGFIFLCSSICNRDLPAVKIARAWLKEHANDVRP